MSARAATGIRVARLADRVLALSTRAPRRSLSLARKGLAESRGAPPAQRARLLRVYGHALRATGDYVAARAAYLESRRLYRRTGEDAERAVTALGLIDACMYLGRTSEAIAVADEARRVFLRSRDVRRLAMLETNVGNVHHQQEDLVQALFHYDRAAHLLAPIGTPAQRASLDHNRANALTHLGRREEAEALYRSALAAFEEAEEPVFAAQVRYGIACLHFLHGEYAAAIVELEEVRPRLAQLGARPLLALADLDLAEVLVAMQLHAEARVLARSARKWFRSRGVGAQEARALLVESVAAAGEGLQREACRAADAADRILARLKHVSGRALVRLIRARIDLGRGRARKASSSAMLAYHAFTRAGFPARALAAAALATESELQAGRWSRARTMARALAHAPQHPGDRFSRMRLARAEGAACDRLGDSRGALRAYREALDRSRDVHASHFVDEWRVGFLGAEPDLLDESLGVLLERSPRPSPREIRSWIVRAARAERDSGKVSRECSPAVARQVRRLRAELEACFARLWHAQGGGDPAMRAVSTHRLERRALRLEGRLRRLAGSRSRPSAGARQRGSHSHRPDAGEVVLTYFPAGGRVGVLRDDARGSTVIRDLMPIAVLERHVQLLHHQMDLRAWRIPGLGGHEDVVRARGGDHLARLGRALLEPVLDVAALPRRVTVIPAGPMQRVPFHGLQVGGRPLAATSEVAIDLSPDLRPSPEGRPGNEAWVLGYDADGASGVVEEAQEVADALARRGLEVRLRLGGDATRAALEQAAERATLIHLAGHALYRSAHPEFSALRLADGCVNVGDFAMLDLRGAVVVLSACETGPRGASGSYEPLGLVRGLMRAGARGVLASLWRVDGAATLAEMRALYEAWPGRGLGEAWREAQLRSRADSGDPFLWAAFSLFGDPDAPCHGACAAPSRSGNIVRVP